MSSVQRRNEKMRSNASTTEAFLIPDMFDLLWLYYLMCEWVV